VFLTSLMKEKRFSLVVVLDSVDAFLFNF